jgi:sterol desaturase/sphingolipid hydroxylase (fatty acid hydroxylase superfamily)
VWDRLFKTYKNDPIGGQSEMKVGLDWQDDHPAKLTWTLFLPFKE